MKYNFDKRINSLAFKDYLDLRLEENKSRLSEKAIQHVVAFIENSALKTKIDYLNYIDTQVFPKDTTLYTELYRLGSELLI